MVFYCKPIKNRKISANCGSWNHTAPVGWWCVSQQDQSMQTPFVDGLPRSHTLFCWWDVSVILPSSSFYRQTQHYYCTTQHTTTGTYVSPTINHMQATTWINIAHTVCALPSPPAATQWSSLLLHNVICSERIIMHFQSGGNLFWWPWPLTLTFKLVWERDQTRLPCEFSANPFSGPRNISQTKKKQTRMRTNAQHNGRPAKHRWCPLFNAAKFGWRPLPCSNAAKMWKPLKLAGVPQTGKPISAASGPKFTILWGHLENILLLNKLFSIVDTCLNCEDIAQQSCAMVPRWQFLATFWGPAFPESHVLRAACFRPAS